jgi:hypothetical protein
VSAVRARWWLGRRGEEKRVLGVVCAIDGVFGFYATTMTTTTTTVFVCELLHEKNALYGSDRTGIVEFQNCFV